MPAEETGFLFLYTVYKRTMAAVLLERRDAFTHDVRTGCVGCNVAGRDQDLKRPNAAIGPLGVVKDRLHQGRVQYEFAGRLRPCHVEAAYQQDVTAAIKVG